jgi:hypothetical protein
VHKSKKELSEDEDDENEKKDSRIKTIKKNKKIKHKKNPTGVSSLEDKAEIRPDIDVENMLKMLATPHLAETKNSNKASISDTEGNTTSSSKCEFLYKNDISDIKFLSDLLDSLDDFPEQKFYIEKDEEYRKIVALSDGA